MKNLIFYFFLILLFAGCNTQELLNESIPESKYTYKDPGGCHYLVISTSEGIIKGITHMGDCPNPIHKYNKIDTVYYMVPDTETPKGTYTQVVNIEGVDYVVTYNKLGIVDIYRYKQGESRKVDPPKGIKRSIELRLGIEYKQK